MFWMIVAALCIVAVAVVVLPLLTRAKDSPLEHDVLRAAVLQTQGEELEQDRAAGLIDEEQFRQAKDELAREAQGSKHGAAPAPRAGHSPLAAGVLALAIPLVAVGVYHQVGTDPQAAAAHGSPAGTAMGAGMEMPDVNAMVDRLKQRLENNPDDPEGWSMLIRSLASLGRLDEIAAMLRSTFDKGYANAELYAQYADLLATKQGSLAGEPVSYLDKALALDPDNLQALWLAGAAAYENKDLKTIVKHWERLQGLLEPGSEDARIISENLALVRSELGGKAK